MSNLGKQQLKGTISTDGQQLKGTMSTAGRLIGDCEIGRLPAESADKLPDIPDDGAILERVDGEWVVHPLSEAEEVRY